MECDAVIPKTNSTPLIYNHLLFKDGGQEQFLKELSDIYNKFGLDSRLNIRDYLLAEMTLNLLAIINNTMDEEFKMKTCNEPETIKSSDCNPKAQPCVLTNNGKQKPSWSNEDEKILYQIQDHLREYYVDKKGYPYVAEHNSNEMIEFNWLKSLKERMI